MCYRKGFLSPTSVYYYTVRLISSHIMCWALLDLLYSLKEFQSLSSEPSLTI
nr:MAG TPA: hypothetical protein [Bacteriophage sp.]